MNLDEICTLMKTAGAIIKEHEGFEIISPQDLETRALNDKYSAAVKKALEINSDSESPLYKHQFEALYALSEGQDVLLITPCSSGKTRVLENGPEVVKLGFELRSSETDLLPCPNNPLGIVCCPLSSIMEDKLRVQSKTGILSMYGGCKSKVPSKEGKDDVTWGEEEFLTDQLSLIYGHPESFATNTGKNILEANESRICLYATDEVGFNIWGSQFRILMSSVPGSIRVFSPSAPMLCMSATVGKMEQGKILDDLGMLKRRHKIIETNPVKDYFLVTKIKRPSNQTGFDEEGGLGEILGSLYLEEFVSDPVTCRKALIYCKNEEDLVHIYQFVEGKIGSQFLNMKRRPWVQYHSSLGESTLKWVHKRMELSGEGEIKLILTTYKLVMGVDLQNVDLAIFVRFALLPSAIYRTDSYYSGLPTPYHALSREWVGWADPPSLVPNVLESQFSTMKKI